MSTCIPRGVSSVILQESDGDMTVLACSSPVLGRELEDCVSSGEFGWKYAGVMRGLQF